MGSTIDYIPEWRSLSAEPDPELRAEGMLTFARRLESRGDESGAAEVYSHLLEAGSGCPEGQRRRTEERLGVLSGGGNFGERAERYISHFVQQSTDPSALLAMGVAGSVFRIARLGVLARLSAGPTSYFTRGLAARSVASLTGLMAESLAFPLTARGAQAVLGHSQDWTIPTLAHEWGASLLTLGALRGSGSLMGLLARRAGQGPISNILLSQTSMLGGIWLAQHLEGRLGWRRAEGGADSFASALATLLQFNVSARLSRAAFGSRFARWESHLDLRAQALARPPRQVDAAWSFPQPLFATAVPLEISTLGEKGPRPAPAANDSREITTTFPPTLYQDYRYPSGIGEVQPPRIEYSKEWRDWWKLNVPQLRAVDSRSSAEEILANRLSLREINRFWRFQIEDFANLVGAKLSVHSSDRLLEAMGPGVLKRDPRLLRAAQALAGEGTEVYELDFPYSSVRFGEANERGDYANLHSLLRDIGEDFGNHVLLAHKSAGRIQVRIPSLDLWEALNLAQFGENAHRMVPVKGVIARDRMMGFREKMLAPLGMTLQATRIQDIQGRAHSFFFTLHDAFHATVASSLPNSFARSAGRLYWLAKARLPASSLKEDLLDRFADMDPGTEYKNQARPNEFWDFTLAHFWKRFVEDAKRDDFIGGRLEQYPKFLQRYQSLIQGTSPQNPAEARSFEYISSVLQEDSRRLSSLLLEVLRK